MINRHAELRTRLLRQLADREVARAPHTRSEQRIARVRGLPLGIVVWKCLLEGANKQLGQLRPLTILLIGGWLVIEGRATVGTVVASLSGFERIIDPARERLDFDRQLAQARVQLGFLQAVA